MLPYYAGAILLIWIAAKPPWWESSTSKWHESFGPGKTPLVNDWSIVGGAVTQWKSWESWLTLGSNEPTSTKILFCTGR